MLSQAEPEMSASSFIFFPGLWPVSWLHLVVNTSILASGCWGSFFISTVNPCEGVLALRRDRIVGCIFNCLDSQHAPTSLAPALTISLLPSNARTSCVSAKLACPETSNSSGSFLIGASGMLVSARFDELHFLDKSKGAGMFSLIPVNNSWGAFSSTPRSALTPNDPLLGTGDGDVWRRAWPGATDSAWGISEESGSSLVWEGQTGKNSTRLAPWGGFSLRVRLHNPSGGLEPAGTPPVASPGLLESLNAAAGLLKTTSGPATVFAAFAESGFALGVLRLFSGWEVWRFLGTFCNGRQQYPSYLTCYAEPRNMQMTWKDFKVCRNPFNHTFVLMGLHFSQMKTFKLLRVCKMPGWGGKHLFSNRNLAPCMDYEHILKIIFPILHIHYRSHILKLPSFSFLKIMQFSVSLYFEMKV